MRTRCTNPNSKSFAAYGGSGVAVCERWEAFSNFLDDMGERPPGTVLDRERNNEGYEPSNCRWLALPLSNVNRRNVTLVRIDGAEVSLKAASKLRKLNYPSMRRLMKSGLSSIKPPSVSRQSSRGDERDRDLHSAGVAAHPT